MISTTSASMENAASAYSPAGLVASSSNSTSGASSYYNWQYGGFSRSNSRAASYVDTSVPNSSSSIPISSLSAAITSGGDDGNTPNSLSGYVFFDENANGAINVTDWAILDAEIQLTNQNSGDTWKTYTNADGYYIFDGLAPGTYSISMVTTTVNPGLGILGQLYDSDGSLLPDAGKTTADGFSDIVLDGGDFGINYAFCESEYPVGCISKRLLISGGPKHTVPEPAMFALLAIAGLVLGTHSLRGKSAI